jgi:hypothetical protein
VGGVIQTKPASRKNHGAQKLRREIPFAAWAPEDRLFDTIALMGWLAQDDALTTPSFRTQKTAL